MSSLLRGASLSKAPGRFPSSPGDRGIEPAARSSLSRFLQAFAAGLQPEAAAYAAGLKDGEEGAEFRPLHFDVYSYALGFQRGRQFPRRGGVHAL